MICARQPEHLPQAVYGIESYVFHIHTSHGLDVNLHSHLAEVNDCKGVYSYLYWLERYLPTLLQLVLNFYGLNVLSISRVACIAKRLEQVFEHYYCYDYTKQV